MFLFLLQKENEDWDNERLGLMNSDKLSGLLSQSTSMVKDCLENWIAVNLLKTTLF